MRIAFLSTANSWHIGARTKYFVRRGHDVFYLGTLPGTEQSIKPKGVRCIEIGSRYRNRFLRLIDRSLQIRKLTKRHKIDILHSLSMDHSIYGPVSCAKKLVFGHHGSDVLVLPEQSRIYRILYKVLYRVSDAVVQNSRVSQKAGIRYGAPKKNNEIIELGVDFKVFHLNVPKGRARRRLGLNETQKMVFSPRAFTELYDIESIIRSIVLVRKAFPDVMYVFCRHFGDLGSRYEELAEQIGVKENILFTGFLDNETEMPFFYADADVVVSVPLSDSSPGAVYEAMACGTPVIVSELPWYHGKFQKDKDLLTVHVKDYRGLGCVTLQVLKGEKMPDVKSAYHKVKQNIDINKHGKKLECLYKRILSG